MHFKDVTDSLIHFFSTLSFSLSFWIYSEGFEGPEDSCFPSFFIPLMFCFCCLVAETEREAQANMEEGKPKSLHVQMVCFLKNTENK